MKKTIFLGIFFLLVLSSVALADLSITQDSETFVKIGGISQRRSNPDEDVNETITATFTLTNDDVNNSVTGLVFSTTGINAKYVVQFIGAPTEIAANSSVNVTIQGYVPIDLDAVDSNGNKTAVELGTMTVNGTGADPVTANVYMEARNRLSIERVDITWNGEDERVDDGETIEDIRPGQSIEVLIEIENLFDDSDDEDFDIEDVEAEVEIDSEFDADDDSKDVGDISAEETEEVTFNMEVEADADDGTYDLVITVIGEDENEARHGERWVIDLEINREKEDIRIKTAEFLPETVSCDRDVRLEVKIENMGSRDSDEIVLLVESDDFDYKQKLVEIDLDTEDDYSRTFNIDIPEDVEAGIYLFSIKTFFDSKDYNEDDYSDVKDVVLTVRDCAVTEPDDEDEEEEEAIIVQPPVTPPTGGVVYGQPVSAVEDFFDTSAYLALLAVGGLIGIALLFLAIAIIVRR